MAGINIIIVEAQISFCLVFRLAHITQHNFINIERKFVDAIHNILFR